jgi:hypothetical protein
MFSVFVICWLNLAITPCVMAMEPGQGCPHAPELAAQAAGHHAHHDAKATHDCETMQSDCCDLDAASVDGRGSKLKSSSDDLSIVPFDTPWLLDPIKSMQKPAVPPPDPVGFSPPLHKLYCVYLN